MPKIIKNDSVIDDPWEVLKLAEGDSADSIALPDLSTVPTLLPLAVWQARKAEIITSKAPVGVWLASNEDPKAIADDLAHFALIAVDFPKFTDGRSYSTARLLRERYDYRGEIRAIGDVLFDQLFYMKRVGINAYAVRADTNIDKALAGLRTFSETYQTAVDQPLPLFRRRAA